MLRHLVATFIATFLGENARNRFENLPPRTDHLSQFQRRP